ncbi:MAG: hypothetical protein FJ138_10485 [Deltaproteobacteria bacterium]|nr:hypothetical protein [Deltaproteobacteria bacterium]
MSPESPAAPLGDAARARAAAALFHARVARALLALWALGALLVAHLTRGEGAAALPRHLAAFSAALALTWLDLWLLSAGVGALLRGAGSASGLLLLKALALFPLLFALVALCPDSLLALLLGSSAWVLAVLYAALREARAPRDRA